MNNRNIATKAGFTKRKDQKAKNHRDRKGRKDKRRNSPFRQPNLLTNFQLPPIKSYGLLHKDCKKGLVKLRKKLPLLQRWPMALAIIYNVDAEVVRSAVQQMILELDKRIAYRGFVPTMKFMKEFQGKLLRFSCNHSFDPVSHNNLDEFGLPKEFSLLVQMSRVIGPEGPNYRACADSIAQVYRLFLPKGDSPSTAAITSPWSGSPFLQKSHTVDFLEQVSEEVLGKEDSSRLGQFYRTELYKAFPRSEQQKRLKQILDHTEIHISAKNGPNGPSVLSFPIDLKMIKGTALEPSVKWFMGLKISKDLKRLWKYATLTPPNILGLKSWKPCLSRISEKTEPGSKVRLFAILDGLTQSLLSGLHWYSFTWLASQEQDGTFSHGLAAQRVQARTFDYYGRQNRSSDLSEATNLFPAMLQVETVYAITGLWEFAQHWYNLMCNRDFVYSGQTIRYAVGQPMGALSSWAIFAITHHILVRSLLRFFQYHMMDSYTIIGDDIHIFEYYVGIFYDQVMKEILRVPVNPLKGYSPDTVSGKNPLGYGKLGNQTYVAELAKRTFYNGFEISGISPNTIFDGLENPHCFKELIIKIGDKRSTPDATFVVPWRMVEVLLTLSFRERDALRLVTFPSPTAVSPVGDPVGGSKDSKYRKLVPWCFDPEMDEAIRDLVINNLAYSLKSRVQSLLDELTSTKLSTRVEGKNFVVDWVRYPTYNRLLTKKISNVLWRTLEKLGGLGINASINELFDISQELYQIREISDVLEFRERQFIDNRIKFSQDYLKAIKSVLSSNYRDRTSLLELHQPTVEFAIQPFVEIKQVDGWDFTVVNE